jgi:hypothetical protein
MRFSSLDIVVYLSVFSIKLRLEYSVERNYMNSIVRSSPALSSRFGKFGLSMKYFFRNELNMKLSALEIRRMRLL